MKWKCLQIKDSMYQKNSEHATSFKCYDVRKVVEFLDERI